VLACRRRGLRPGGVLFVAFCVLALAAAFESRATTQAATPADEPNSRRTTVEAAEAAAKEGRPVVLGLSTGFDYYRGDYGDLDVAESMTVPIAVSVDYGAFGVGLTIPLRRAEIGAEVCNAERLIEVALCRRFAEIARDRGLLDFVSESSWGLGDVQLDASGTWIPDAVWAPAMTGFGSVSFPTGDVDKALGTGGYDVTLGTDLSWLAGPTLPFVSAGYVFADDAKGLGLENFPFASVGLAWEPVRPLTLSFSYDWRGPAAEGEGDAHSISPSVLWRPGRHFSVELFGALGLSRSAPDYGVGTRIALRMPVR